MNVGDVRLLNNNAVMAERGDSAPRFLVIAMKTQGMSVFTEGVGLKRKSIISVWSH